MHFSFFLLFYLYFIVGQVGNLYKNRYLFILFKKKFVKQKTNELYTVYLYGNISIKIRLFSAKIIQKK